MYTPFCHKNKFECMLSGHLTWNRTRDRVKFYFRNNDLELIDLMRNWVENSNCRIQEVFQKKKERERKGSNLSFRYEHNFQGGVQFFGGGGDPGK